MTNQHSAVRRTDPVDEEGSVGLREARYRGGLQAFFAIQPILQQDMGGPWYVKAQVARVPR